MEWRFRPMQHRTLINHDRSERRTGGGGEYKVGKKGRAPSGQWELYGGKEKGPGVSGIANREVRFTYITSSSR